MEEMQTVEVSETLRALSEYLELDARRYDTGIGVTE